MLHLGCVAMEENKCSSIFPCLLGQNVLEIFSVEKQVP